MPSPPDPPALGCRAEDVVRGIARLFHRQGLTTLTEVPLPGGRRADLLAIDARGAVTIVEVKVARADLLGDHKWVDYLDWCDRFYWALSSTLDADLLAATDRLQGRAGLIVADRYEAAIIHEATPAPLAASRRKAQQLRIARLAMRRLMLAADPELHAHAGEWDIGV